MIIAAEDPPLPCGCKPQRCYVFDANGQEMKGVVKVDTDRGEVHRYVKSDGVFVLNANRQLSLEVVKVPFTVRCQHGEVR